MKLYIGTSGFTYAHWREVFYPAGVSQRRWLEFYAGHFTTVELNSTFYHLPKDSTFEGWAQRVPARFIYAVKVSRYITHLKHLHEVGESLERFLHGARLLGEHLGPLLIQLPPGMKLDLPRLEEFLALCDPSLRWTMEFRNSDWLRQDTYDLLARFHVALCIHDMIENHPQEITAPFIYLRFHGTNRRYGGSYPDDHLHDWAEQIMAWQRDGHDVYAYFNNDMAGYAVQNAQTLIRLCREMPGYRQAAA
ncbi:MAG: DUF72 domain-containing protein [Armatimonadota bacterium]